MIKTNLINMSNNFFNDKLIYKDYFSNLKNKPIYYNLNRKLSAISERKAAIEEHICYDDDNDDEEQIFIYSLEDLKEEFILFATDNNRSITDFMTNEPTLEIISRREFDNHLYDNLYEISKKQPNYFKDEYIFTPKRFRSKYEYRNVVRC